MMGYLQRARLCCVCCLGLALTARAHAQTTEPPPDPNPARGEETLPDTSDEEDAPAEPDADIANAPTPSTATPPGHAAPTPEAAKESAKADKKRKKALKRARRMASPRLVPWRFEARAPKLGTLTPTGRVFVHGTLERHHESVIDANGATRDTNVDSLDLSIRSARLGLVYDAPVPWLRANVELELTGKPKLTDAWLRGRFRYATVKLGQFKTPFSAIEMESAWALPLARRGLLHQALVNELQIGGRRPGVTLEGHARGKLRPSLTLGAFQASVLVDEDPDQRDVDKLSEQSLFSQSFFARAELRVHDFVFGLDYEDRSGTPALLETKHYFTLGANATLDTDVRGIGLRVWAEGMTGASWLENWYKPPDGRDATFWATRLVTAVRFGGARRGDAYIEPYAMLGLMDPDTEVSQDLAAEEVLGVNVGLWKLARLGLEAEMERVERNFPQTYYLGDDPDRIALVLHAGAEF